MFLVSGRIAMGGGRDPVAGRVGVSAVGGAAAGVVLVAVLVEAGFGSTGCDGVGPAVALVPTDAAERLPVARGLSRCATFANRKPR